MKRKLLLALATIGVITLTAPAIASSSAPIVPAISTPAAAYTVADTLPSTKSLATVYSVPIADGKDTVRLIAKSLDSAWATSDFETIADAKVLSDPDWRTISAMRGVIDDGPATLKTALVGSPQGGGESSYSATTTLATGSGSSTAAPAIGHSPGPMQTDRSAVAFITV